MVLKDVDKKSCLSYSERTTSKIPSGSPEPGQCQVLSIMFFLYALHHRYMVADISLSFVCCSGAFSASPSLNFGVVTKGNRSFLDTALLYL